MKMNFILYISPFYFVEDLISVKEQALISVVVWYKISPKTHVLKVWYKLVVLLRDNWF
jgi:hypothetical protein